MSKYPYIQNKKMYAAVMGACKWIRQDGYFNKAVKYYADKFNVDEKELENHIRARQSAGQKGKKRGNYKYYRYKGEATLYCREMDYGVIEFDLTFKALNKDNAHNQLYKKLLDGYDPLECDLIFEFEINGETVNK